MEKWVPVQNTQKSQVPNPIFISLLASTMVSLYVKKAVILNKPAKEQAVIYMDTMTMKSSLRMQ
jgi:hypothetical protein